MQKNFSRELGYLKQLHVCCSQASFPSFRTCRILLFLLEALPCNQQSAFFAEKPNVTLQKKQPYALSQFPNCVISKEGWVFTCF